jgi:hypothetical protein
MTDTTTVTELTTPTGKTLTDFRIPAKLTQSDAALIELIMKSESMKDEERQYWFNLYEVMNTAQIDKLRDILTRERAKLAEIDAKYGKKPKIDPVEAAKKAEEMAQKRSAEQKILKEREAKIQAQEAQAEADILSELDGL